MRNCILLTVLLLFSLGISSMVQAEEPTSVYDAIQGGKGDAPVEQPLGNTEQQPALDEDLSIFPFLVKLFVSLAFIIILIYLLLRFWATKTRAIQSRGPFTMLGACPLGTNRSIQVVQLGKTLYVLGVGEDVQLLRTLEPGEEYDDILGGFEAASAPFSSPLSVKQWFQKEEKNVQNWEEVFQAKLQDLQGQDSVELWMDDQEEKRKR